MDNTNKIISFILGLVVVVVFLVVIISRFRGTNRVLSNRTATPTPTASQKQPGFLEKLFKKNTPTPTSGPTNTPTPTNSVVQRITPSLQISPQVDGHITPTTSPTTIPNTGAETYLIPLMGLLLLAGFFLRKYSQE